MNTEILKTDNETIVKIEGRLDTITAPQLEAIVADVIIPENNIVFDCNDMEYISSAGLRVVLSTYKKATAVKAKFALRGLSKDVMQVFEMTGFSKILTIE